MTLPCTGCQHPVDIEGLCLNPECPLLLYSEEVASDRRGSMDDAQTLALAAEDLFRRMKAYADSDPMRACWVSGYTEGYAMKLGELIHEHPCGEHPGGTE